MTAKRTKLNPAKRIIEVFGGEVAIAALCGVAVSTVYSWQYSKEEGGTGGTIPQPHHVGLLKQAKEKGLLLSAEHFLPVSEELA